MSQTITGKSFAEQLDAWLSDLRVVHRRTEFRALPNGFWSVTCHQDPRGRLKHLVTLAWGYAWLRPGATGPRPCLEPCGT
jgi:hypothetical protein